LLLEIYLREIFINSKARSPLRGEEDAKEECIDRGERKDGPMLI